MLLAEHDILRAEGESFGQRLIANGVPLELTTYVGQVHGFLEALGVMADARDAVARAGAAIRSAFAQARLSAASC
jgi:acetyl esterase